MRTLPLVLLILGGTVVGLALAGVLGAAILYEEAKPVLERYAPTPLADHERACVGVFRCNDLEESLTFGPPDGAREIQARLNVTLPATGGSVRVLVTDPDGKSVLDRTFTAGAEATQVDETFVWSPTAGTWRFEADYAAFGGTLDFEAWALGVEPGSLG